MSFHFSSAAMVVTPSPPVTDSVRGVNAGTVSETLDSGARLVWMI